MRISWDDSDRLYSQGVSNGVLYPENSPGVAWCGLISVTESGDDSSTAYYMDGIRYLTQGVLSTFAGVISAFMYPDEFEQYNGNVSGVTSQPRTPFGFSWQTNREIHIVYNALAAPSSDQYSTLSSDVNPISFSWNFSTLPMDIPAGRPSSHLVVMVDYAQPDAVAALEAILYGDDSNDPSLPDPTTVYDLFESFTTLMIADNGDGTWTATGPDDVITMLDSDTFQIDWPSAMFIDANTYTIQSL